MPLKPLCIFLNIKMSYKTICRAHAFSICLMNGQTTLLTHELNLPPIDFFSFRFLTMKSHHCLKVPGIFLF